MINPLRVVIDSREQMPWNFGEESAVTRRGKIDAGDYALEGDPFFAIERKSLDDFLGTIASGWERFQRELTRMDGHVAKVIVVEGTLKDVFEGKHNHPNLTLGFVLKRIARLTLSRVSVIMAGDRAMAAAVGYSILKCRSMDLENLYGTDQSDSGADCAGAGVDVPQAGLEVDDSSSCPSGLQAKMHRQGDSGVRAEARRPVGA